MPKKRPYVEPAPRCLPSPSAVDELLKVAPSPLVQLIAQPRRFWHFAGPIPVTRKEEIWVPLALARPILSGT